MLITDVNDAKKVALKLLERESGICFYENKIIYKDYGWYLFYQECKYIQTGKLIDALFGGSPILVLKDGSAYYVKEPISDIDFLEIEKKYHIKY